MYFKDAIPFNEPYETSGHLEAATISFIDILVQLKLLWITNHIRQYVSY